ncbi:MAG TPA: type II toxin-antitoxin system PemK/MazF family toxin [Candidatus Saccharimonadia bacterium]|nr:type II toxin-antitoxin system PemK/MazF family toxin [Candidatus Saccharimonadia bacterium]
MTDSNPGDVVLIPFPFTDLSTVKQRPAVMLSSTTFNHHHQDVIMVALTSHVPEVLTSDEYLLNDDEQREAGLPKPSIVKVGKIVTLDQRLIRKQLGRMPETGRQQLIHIAMTIFGAA